MNVLELESREYWEEVLHRVARETKMTVTLTDEKGNSILHTQGTRCPLCAKIRKNEESLTFICSQCNTVMLEEVKRVQRPIVDYCDAGLSRMVVPIVRDGVLVGQLTACGGAPEAEEMDLFLIAKQVGITEAEAEALAASTPVVSEDEVRMIANQTFAELNP